MLGYYDGIEVYQEKPKMLKANVIARLNGVIAQLSDRVIQSKDPMITEEDVLNAFVRPDLRAMAKTAFKEFQVRTPGLIEVRQDGICLNIYAGDCKFAPPLDISGRRIYDEEAKAKLFTWRDWRVQMGQQWGLVQDVFQALIWRCKSLEEVRFYWQPIVVLLQSVDPNLSSRLEDIKPLKSVTPIPVELRRACTETCGTVAMGCIMPTEMPKWPIRLTVDSGYPTGKLPWDDSQHITGL